MTTGCYVDQVVAISWSRADVAHYRMFFCNQETQHGSLYQIPKAGIIDELSRGEQLLLSAQLWSPIENLKVDGILPGGRMSEKMCFSSIYWEYSTERWVRSFLGHALWTTCLSWQSIVRVYAQRNDSLQCHIADGGRYSWRGSCHLEGLCTAFIQTSPRTSAVGQLRHHMW